MASEMASPGVVAHAAAGDSELSPAIDAPVKAGVVAQLRMAYEQRRAESAAAASSPLVATPPPKPKGPTSADTAPAKAQDELADQMRPIADQLKKVTAAHNVVQQFWDTIVSAEDEYAKAVRRRPSRVVPGGWVSGILTPGATPFGCHGRACSGKPRSSLP